MRRDKAMSFLEKNGAASIIKTWVEAEFGKGQKGEAIKAQKLLQKAGIAAELTSGVHPQTLASWVRERLEGGLAVDMEALAVFNGQKAVIDRPKVSSTFHNFPSNNTNASNQPRAKSLF